MPDSVRPRRRRANALSSRAPDPPNLLARILATPHLAQAVPRLQAEVLHRVIQHVGLEACGDLIALATPSQLAAVFDLDLWSTSRPGQEEQFDADRFGVWLEVLAESGADFAAGKLAAIDAAVVIAALAKDMRVFDGAAGVVDASDRDVGGYRLVAKRGELSETIVAVLSAMEADHPKYFHQVMRGCRKLSNSAPEPDGFHDLLEAPEQAFFDLAFDRELRREKQGFVTPAVARAFLQMSRGPQWDRDGGPSRNPIPAAYFRSIDADRAPESSIADDAGSEATAVLNVLNVLGEAGVLPPRPSGLLTGVVEDSPRLARMRTCLDFARDHDHAVYLHRSQELAFLANVIVAGSSIQARAFTVQEAFDGAAAVCNLGLENWPTAVPDDFLIEHDVVRVFQAGWKVLYADVCMFAAERLVAALHGLQCVDPDTQADIDDLRLQLTRHCELGEPWRSGDALEVIAILDTPSWAALLRLIADFPVMHAVIAAPGSSRRRSVSAMAFEFISENRQIATIREFLASLPDALSG